MNIIWRTLTKKQALRVFYPELKGRVFHITSIENFLEIIKVGAIRHNREGDLKSNGRYDSYFRNRGCVSFCDFYTNSRPRKIREAALTKYNIFGQGDGERFVYLFLRAEAYTKLVTWEEWKREKAWSEMVVPHLESGYPGHVPLSEIQEVCLVHILLDQNFKNSIAALLAAARAAHARNNSNEV